MWYINRISDEKQGNVQLLRERREHPPHSPPPQRPTRSNRFDLSFLSSLSLPHHGHGSLPCPLPPSLSIRWWRRRRGTRLFFSRSGSVRFRCGRIRRRICISSRRSRHLNALLSIAISIPICIPHRSLTPRRRREDTSTRSPQSCRHDRL